MSNDFSFIKQDVITLLGGATKAADFFGCSTSAIYMWPDNKPIHRARQYELVAKLTRPDLFAEQAAVAA